MAGFKKAAPSAVQLGPETSSLRHNSAGAPPNTLLAWLYDARCESALAAYGRERRRNAELVHRLQQLHGEQVDAVELKRRYLQLQEAHAEQVCGEGSCKHGVHCNQSPGLRLADAAQRAQELLGGCRSMR